MRHWRQAAGEGSPYCHVRVEFCGLIGTECASIRVLASGYKVRGSPILVRSRNCELLQHRIGSGARGGPFVRCSQTSQAATPARFSSPQLSLEDLAAVHGIDEKISVERFGQMITFYQQIIVGGGAKELRSDAQFTSIDKGGSRSLRAGTPSRRRAKSQRSRRLTLRTTADCLRSLHGKYCRGCSREP